MTGNNHLSHFPGTEDASVDAQRPHIQTDLMPKQTNTFKAKALLALGVVPSLVDMMTSSGPEEGVRRTRGPAPGTPRGQRDLELEFKRNSSSQSLFLESGLDLLFFLARGGSAFCLHGQ